MANNAGKFGIGIDFGTTNLLVYVQGQGIIFNEPSVVAFDVATGELIAAGFDADSMIGKVHDKIEVEKPLKDGVISDMEVAEMLLRHVFRKVEQYKDFKNATCVICCPSEVTEIERAALQQLARDMGIKDVLIEEEIKACAIGAEIDIYQPAGNMVIDIGGGSTDVGVLSLGDVVLSNSIRVAGNYIDQAVMKYVKQKFKIEIGVKTAERIKINLATLNEEAEERVYRFAGRDIMNGLPKYAEMTSREMTKILLPIFQDIVDVTINTFKDTPPELCADIYDAGIMINGGVGQVDYLTEYLSEKLDLKCQLVPNPLTSVVEGTKLLIKAHGQFDVNPFEL